MPCSTPSDPAVRVAACRPVSRPSPPASQPISATRGVRDERVKDADRVGAAAHAGDDRVGQPAGRVSIWSLASSPMMRWKSLTIIGNGCGPPTEPMQ